MSHLDEPKSAPLKIEKNVDSRQPVDKKNTESGKFDKGQEEQRINRERQEKAETEKEQPKVEKMVDDLNSPDGKVYNPEDFRDTASDFFKQFMKMISEFLKNFIGTDEERKLYFNESDYSAERGVDKIDAKDASDLAKKLGDRHGKIKLDKNIDFNKYKDGDRLGTKQCARFVSESLGLKSIVWSAEELFSRLCEPEKNGQISNLKTNLADVKTGDVVFFEGTYKNGRTITHVGIVTNTSPLKMRHHPTFQKGVETASLESNYWQKHFYGAVTPKRADTAVS